MQGQESVCYACAGQMDGKQNREDMKSETEKAASAVALLAIGIEVGCPLCQKFELLVTCRFLVISQNPDMSESTHGVCNRSLLSLRNSMQNCG